MTHPRTLADLPAPNEAAARRLMALLFPPGGLPAADRNSEPLEVRLP